MPVSEPLRDVHVVDIVLRVLQLEVDEFLDGLAVLIEVVNLLSAKLGQSVLHLDDGLGDVGQYHSLQGPANNKCSRVFKLINPLKTMLLYYRGVTPFGPPMWQAEADTELTLSASPPTAVGQKALALAKRRYSTVYQVLGP